MSGQYGAEHKKQRARNFYRQSGELGESQNETELKEFATVTPGWFPTLFCSPRESDNELIELRPSCEKDEELQLATQKKKNSSSVPGAMSALTQLNECVRALSKLTAGDTQPRCSLVGHLSCRAVRREEPNARLYSAEFRT